MDQIFTFRDTLLHEIGVVVKSPGRDFYSELRRDVLKKANKEARISFVCGLRLLCSRSACYSSATVAGHLSGCRECGGDEGGESQ